jgi:hypothetical protein
MSGLYYKYSVLVALYSCPHPRVTSESLLKGELYHQQKMEFDPSKTNNGQLSLAFVPWSFEGWQSLANSVDAHNVSKQYFRVAHWECWM